MYNENFTIVMIPFNEQFISMNLNLDKPLGHEMITVKKSQKMQNQIVFKMVPYNDSTIRYRVI